MANDQRVLTVKNDLANKIGGGSLRDQFYNLQALTAAGDLKRVNNYPFNKVLTAKDALARYEELHPTLRMRDAGYYSNITQAPQTVSSVVPTAHPNPTSHPITTTAPISSVGNAIVDSNINGLETFTKVFPGVTAIDGNKKIRAFLDLISHSEHTFYKEGYSAVFKANYKYYEQIKNKKKIILKAKFLTEDKWGKRYTQNYSSIVGPFKIMTNSGNKKGTERLFLIKDLSNYPDISAAFKVRTDNSFTHTSAAGRYQIMHDTWFDTSTEKDKNGKPITNLGCKSLLGLTDFSPSSQDKVALKLIQWCIYTNHITHKKTKALDLITSSNGNDDEFKRAVVACSRIWASFPNNLNNTTQASSAYAGQNAHSLDSLKDFWISRLRYYNVSGVITL